ncbi:hypothetical protein B0H15DRAFT_948890 [Mycena belliarum]|uniref:Uncharacterized protein n=1 Tax=Mycena belliarum TaxID=1033014 RepID=A0AAD6U4L8_9AGAR|nr:hypothetical protein B0H15DRAFT_948890 [Mycena belliae]
MSTQTYQPAPDETIGQFADLVFQRLFFQSTDMALVDATFEHDVAPDASITANGKSMTPAEFLESIRGFHQIGVGKLLWIKDLAVVPYDPAGRTGIVAQHSMFSLTMKADGSVKEFTSVALCKVEERNGRRVLASVAEVQT